MRLLSGEKQIVTINFPPTVGMIFRQSPENSYKKLKTLTFPLFYDILYKEYYFYKEEKI